MSAVSKNRVKRLISQIGDIDDVFGEDAVDTPHDAITLTESAETFSTDASLANIFYLNPAPNETMGHLAIQSELTGVVDVIPNGPFNPHYFSITATVNAKDTSGEGFIIYNRRPYVNAYVYSGHHRLSYDTTQPGGSRYVIKTYTSSSSGGVEENVLSSSVIAPNAGDTHLVATYDGTDLNFYVNGSLASGGTKAISGISDQTGQYNSCYFRIGGKNFGSCVVGYGLTGSIYNVAFWNSAITSDHVALLYGGRAPTDVSASSLVSYWPCDEGSGATLNDVHGGYHGEFAGTSSWGTAAVKNFMLANPSNLKFGATYHWIIKQGGNRGITYGSKFRFEGNVPGTLSTSTGKTDMITGIVNDDGTRILCTIKKNFA